MFILFPVIFAVAAAIYGSVVDHQWAAMPALAVLFVIMIPTMNACIKCALSLMKWDNFND